MTGPTVPTRWDLLTPGMWVCDAGLTFGGVTLAETSMVARPSVAGNPWIGSAWIGSAWIGSAWIVGLWAQGRLRTRTLTRDQIHWCDDESCPSCPRVDLREARRLLRRLLEADSTRTSGRTDRDRANANWARNLHHILHDMAAL